MKLQILAHAALYTGAIFLFSGRDVTLTGVTAAAWIVFGVAACILCSRADASTD